MEMSFAPPRDPVDGTRSKSAPSGNPRTVKPRGKTLLLAAPSATSVAARAARVSGSSVMTRASTARALEKELTAAAAVAVTAEDTSKSKGKGKGKLKAKPKAGSKPKAKPDAEVNAKTASLPKAKKPPTGNTGAVTKPQRAAIDAHANETHPEECLGAMASTTDKDEELQKTIDNGSGLDLLLAEETLLKELDRIVAVTADAIYMEEESHTKKMRKLKQDSFLAQAARDKAECASYKRMAARVDTPQSPTSEAALLNELDRTVDVTADAIRVEEENHAERMRKLKEDLFIAQAARDKAECASYKRMAARIEIPQSPTSVNDIKTEVAARESFAMHETGELAVCSATDLEVAPASESLCDISYASLGSDFEDDEIKFILGHLTAADSTPTEAEPHVSTGFETNDAAAADEQDSADAAVAEERDSAVANLLLPSPFDAAAARGNVVFSPLELPTSDDEAFANAPAAEASMAADPQVQFPEL